MPSDIEKDPWVQRLSGEEPERDAALEELRQILLRGLSVSLNNRYGSKFQAEDIIQDALVKIMNSLHTFEGRSRFTTWAMTIATRVGLSALRKRHCKDVSLDSISQDGDLRFELAIDRQAPIGTGLDRDVILQQLETLIDSVLSDRQKFAIRGLLEGLPVEIIADRAGSNRNAIYKLVHDARMKLRAGFENAGITPDDIAAIIA